MRIWVTAAAVAAFLTGFAGSAWAAGKRIALVIGNSTYANAGVLANPAHDAADVGAALKAHGFDVVMGLDLSKQALDGKVREFARKLSDADAAVFYYAGHGLQVGGQNYLVPIDSSLESERDLEFEALRVDFVLRQMELNRADKTNIVFLDACRNNPLTRNLARSMGTRAASLGTGLAQVDGGVGTFIAFSTQPGNVALDGTGRNSPFAGALAKRIREGGRSLNAIMIEVRKDVLAATSGKQVPWDHSALTGDFYFDVNAKPATAGPPSAGGGSAADTAALNARIMKLEEELKSRDDKQKGAELARLKDAHRRIEEQNREDWQRIFDLRRRAMDQRGSERAREMDREAMDLQMKITRRASEARKISDEIGALETASGKEKVP